tara:strand:- start:1776 stop:3473 length:1698 start_codon:yes stop_codon:yes gene_type:complete
MATLSFSQDLKLDHSYTNSDAPFVVGDTISIKFNLLDNDSSTPYFLRFDYQYNNKLLSKIDHTWGLSDNTSAVKNLTHWDGYKFNPITSKNGTDISESDLDAQYKEGWLNRGGSGDSSSYPTNTDWSVERITVQEANKQIAHNTTLLTVRFKVKDRQGTSYDDYTKVTKLNWVKATDNTSTGDDNLYDVVPGPTGLHVNIDNQGVVTGVNSGAITINLNTAAKADHASDFKYTIYKASGTNGKTGDAIKTGTVDANGQIITGAADLTIGVSYYLELQVKDDADWLDDIITVTDVYLIFAQAAGAGSGPSGGNTNTFDYSIQYLLGELNNSGNITFDDSYQALGHIQNVDGLSQWFTSSTNGSKNVWGRTTQLGVSTDDYYFGQDFIFKPLDDAKTFAFGHALIGDVDFSHSYTPTATGAAISQAQQGGGYKNSMTRNAMATPIEANLDITTELIEGKVHLTVDLQEEGLVGTQFNIKYDNIVLTLDDVIFDTGNDMTNISTHFGEDSLVRIGSIDIDGDSVIKLGTAYKLIFTPTETITNTAGLVSFEFTEGVKADGTKVKFIIK